MATAQDLINTAFRKLGAVPAGDTPSAQETADALTDLNGVIDSLNADRLYIYSIRHDSFTLVAGTQSYTIGPSGATFTAARPQKIEEAILVNTAVAPNTRTPIRIINSTAEANIPVMNIGSEIPQTLFFDNGYGSTGIGTITLVPYPSAANTLELWTWALHSAFATAAAPVSFPPGYFELLWSELAIRVAPDYKREVPAAVIKINADARARVEAGNAPSPVMGCDSGLLRIGRGRRYYDIRSNR